MKVFHNAGSYTPSKGIFVQSSHSRKHRKKGKKILTFLLRLFLFFFVVGIAIGSFLFHKYVIKPLPEVSSTELQSLASFAQSSIITDKNGVELYKLFEENRSYVEYDQVSSGMVKAIIATEDKTFRENDGLDYRGIIRVLKDHTLSKLGFDVCIGAGCGGASTVTQQVVRELLLTRDRTVVRKLKEWVLTFDVDDAVEEYIKARYGKNLSKDDLQKKKKEMIMELYMNMVFLGNNAYGVQAAAETYFGKDAKDLNVLESSILAGVIQAPSRYNAYTNRVGEKDCADAFCQGTIGGLLVENK